jgi:hypothetical protein
MGIYIADGILDGFIGDLALLQYDTMNLTLALEFQHIHHVGDVPYVERFMHHVGSPLLENTVAVTIAKHVKIHTDCMCRMYVNKTYKYTMYSNISENTYKVCIPYYT